MRVGAVGQDRSAAKTSRRSETPACQTVASGRTLVPRVRVTLSDRTASLRAIERWGPLTRALTRQCSVVRRRERQFWSRHARSTGGPERPPVAPVFHVSLDFGCPVVSGTRRSPTASWGLRGERVAPHFFRMSLFMQRPHRYPALLMEYPPAPRSITLPHAAHLVGSKAGGSARTSKLYSLVP